VLVLAGAGAAALLRGTVPGSGPAPVAAGGVAAAEPGQQGEGSARTDPPPAPAPSAAAPPPGRSETAGEAADPRATAPAAPRPASGRLTIRVRPWAEVWIDGARRPPVQGTETFPLPAGRHRVVLRGPDGVPATFQVMVRAGRTTAVPPSGGPLDVSGGSPAPR